MRKLLVHAFMGENGAGKSPANRASWGVRNWTVLPSRIISPESGPVRSCQIFMSVVGAEKMPSQMRLIGETGFR
jgi:hypothetical protein